MLKPLNDLVLIQQFQAEQKTIGGIILPSDDGAILAKGQVLSISDGWTTQQGFEVKPKVKIGDIVVYNPKLGTPLNQGVLIREADLYGIEYE